MHLHLTDFSCEVTDTAVASYCYHKGDNVYNGVVPVTQVRTYVIKVATLRRDHLV